MKISDLRTRLQGHDNFSTTTDSPALTQLKSFAAKLGELDRELAPHDLYVLFKTVLVKTVPKNQILQAPLKEKESKEEEDNDATKLFSEIYDSITEVPTANHIPIFTVAFWRRLEELEVLNLASEPNFNKICALNITKAGAILDLLRLMQEFKLLTQANFDLVIKNPAYTEIVVHSEEFRDGVFAGHELRWGPPGEPVANPVLDETFIYINYEKLAILLCIPQGDGSKTMDINITAQLSESLKYALCTSCALLQHDISVEDYAALQKIALQYKTRLANRLTPEIFKVFFIDVPSAIHQAVENYFVKIELKYQRACQDSLLQGAFAQRFGEDKELQLVVINALKIEFEKFKSKTKRFPTYEFVGAALKVADYSFLSHDKIASRAIVIRQHTGTLDTMLSIFGKAPKLPPITLDPELTNGKIPVPH
jgi:hypothetical protein